jgi:lipopolysaccharide export system permease protein
VLKEHVGPFVFSISALTSLMLLQVVARKFGDLVGKGLSWQVIAEFFVLSVPYTLAMTLPMGVLVAVLYAFSRLASENEITALRAGGVSNRALMVPVLIASIFASIGLLAFNDQVLPPANHRLATLTFDIFRTKPTFALKPQVINTIKEGQLYLRAGNIDEATQRMSDVSIYDHQDPTQRRTIYAHSGTLALAPNRRDLIMTLYDGQMISVQTNEPGQLSHVYYAQDRLRVPDVANQFQESSSDTTSKGDREMSVCEMQTQYDQAVVDYRMAEYDALRARLSARAIAGHITRPPEPPSNKAPRSYGLGALYCRLITSLFHVQRAEAAEPTHHPRAAGARAAAQKPAAAPPPPNPAATMQTNDFGSSLREREALSRQRTMLIEIYKKFSLAAACIVFVLVGAPIALRFPRGGVGLVIAVSFGIFAIYDVGLVGGEALANNGLVPPFLAMWGVNILFLLVGLVMITRMGRESATARGGTSIAERVDATRLWFQRQRQRWGGGGPLTGMSGPS